MEETKMKRKLTLVMALMLALALTVAGFAGCASTTNESKTDADATPSVAATEAPTEAASEEPSEAAGESFTIGVTQIVDHPSLNLCKQGALDKLAELGYKEGENLTVSFANAQGDTAVATTIAQQFVADKVDAIMAIATPSAQAAYAATAGSIPVVFSAVSEPAAAELANADGTNISGVTGTSDKLPVAATFELIKALTPNAVKVGILHNTSEVNSDVQLAEAKEKAAEYGLEIVDVGITSTNEIASALDTLLPKVDVVMNLTDNMVVSSLPMLVQKCNEAKIPLYGSEDTQVTSGALASAGVDYYKLGQMTGEMIAKILEGTPAEQLPIAMMDQPMLTVNSDQLTLLGLTVPDSITDRVTLVTTEAAEDTES
jgi:putative ABC transport system substrate-binding protein